MAAIRYEHVGRTVTSNLTHERALAMQTERGGYLRPDLKAKPAPRIRKATKATAPVVAPRPAVDRTCQVMHAVELAQRPEVKAARPWPTWLKLTAAAAGFAGGLLAGMGPIAALIGP